MHRLCLLLAILCYSSSLFSVRVSPSRCTFQPGSAVKSGGSVGAQRDQQDFTGVFMGKPSGLQEVQRQPKSSKVKQLVDLKVHQPGSRRETSSRRSPTCFTRLVLWREVMKLSWPLSCWPEVRSFSPDPKQAEGGH